MKKAVLLFLRSSIASIAVEFAICVPIFITAFLGMWDLVNYSLAKGRVQNQAMILAQLITDPKFSLNYSLNSQTFVDYHSATNTFGLEQIIPLFNTSGEGQGYSYVGHFIGTDLDGLSFSITFDSDSAGNVSYQDHSANVSWVTVSPNTLPFEITVTYKIPTPFLEFAFPSSVQATTYSYPMKGALNIIKRVF